MKFEFGYIYMITSPSNRIYIGSTVNIKRRFHDYKTMHCKCQPKLYRSFVKYGVKNHIFEELCKTDIKNMLYYEAVIGLQYEVLNKGLNCRIPKLSDKYICFKRDAPYHKNSAYKKGHISEKRNITDEIVLKIKELLKTDIKINKIAKLFNISRYKVSDIKRNKSYLNVN